jgi:alpha-methylacyl-CoA racemase
MKTMTHSAHQPPPIEANKKHANQGLCAPEAAATTSACTSTGIGALAGLRVIEFAGIGPAPFAGMMLADMGAEVIVIDRAQDVGLRPGMQPGAQAIHRGKRSIALNLKSAQGMAVVWQLLASGDALIEGFRPGVMERLGLSPKAVAAQHPRLVYGRVTGWGQTGPLALAAGHDINYVALSGALSTAQRQGQQPALPATLVGDMGGGAMFLLYGLMCALWRAKATGIGQVVDAAMLDGVAAMSALVQQMRGNGFWQDAPEQNLFLHNAPFYDSFECADGKSISLGAIEPQFYAQMLHLLGLDDVNPKAQYDAPQWPALKARVAARIKTKTQADWCATLEGSEACFAPVLSLAEAPTHPHNQARGLYTKIDDTWQPAPAPRLSQTPAHPPRAGTALGAHTDALLTELGYTSEAIAALRTAGVCA